LKNVKLKKLSYEQEGDSEIYRADYCKYCHSDSNGPGSHQLYGRVTIATALPSAEKPNMQTGNGSQSASVSFAYISV
jgi:hypothetical protein